MPSISCRLARIGGRPGFAPSATTAPAGPTAHPSDLHVPQDKIIPPQDLLPIHALVGPSEQRLEYVSRWHDGGFLERPHSLVASVVTDNGPMTSFEASSFPAELDQHAAGRMWADYVATYPEHRGDRPPSERFGDSVELADELLDLVLHGPKRATAGAAAEFIHEGEPLPRIGGHWIVHDGAGVPRVVLRSVELRLGPLDSVDASFAWDEGEGDRTRESWLREHQRFFQRALPRIGAEYHDRMEVVFERFRVVWPAEYADD